MNCFGYSAECPEHISFYYKENMDKCFLSEICYKSWIKSGGRLGLEGIIKYGENRTGK